MSSQQISLLSRGLTFAPTVHFDLYRTIFDVNRFVRNVTVKKQFQAFSNDDFDIHDSDGASPVSLGTPHTGGTGESPLIQKQCDFSDLVVTSILQTLTSENTNDENNDSGADFLVKNKFFYPVHLPWIYFRRMFSATLLCYMIKFR